MSQKNNIPSNNKKPCQEEDFDIYRKLDEKEKELVAEGVRRTLDEYGEVIKRLSNK